MVKKRGKIKAFFLVSLIILSLLFLFQYKNITGNAISPITFPSDCSEANIKALWDSIFNESSTGIRYNSTDLNTNNSACDYIFAVKNISNTSYCLFVSNEINKTFLFAKKATYNSTDDQFNLSAIDLGDPLTRIFLLFLMFPSPNEVNRTSTISDGNTANTTFSSTFKKLLNSSWVQNITYGLIINQEYYSSSDMENYSISGENFSRIIGGNVFKTVSDEVFIYADGKINTSSCAPNWTRQETGCFANETKVTWYNDSNNCRVNTSKPESIIHFCDYNYNGIIGDAGSLGTGYNFSIFISGSSLNNSLNYSANNAEQAVEIKNNGSTIVSFKHNFASSPIDFNNLSIKVNSDSSVYGYIVVNGISDTKSVILDRKNSSSNQVCIKDAYVSTITTISSICEDEDEYLLNCPSSTGGFDCVIINNKFNISGLEHSAVKEVLSLGICNPNWTCTNFSVCANLLQSRACSDQNNCNTTSNRPALNSSCDQDQIINSCAPNWVCDGWQPENCSSGKNQTRVCTDKNSCNINTGKPEQIQVCEKTNSYSLLLIGLAVVIFIILTVLIILLFLKKKPSGAQPPVQNQQPFQPPVQPFQRIQPRPLPFPQQQLPPQQLPPQPVIIPQYSIPPRDNRQ